MATIACIARRAGHNAAAASARRAASSIGCSVSRLAAASASASAPSLSAIRATPIAALHTRTRALAAAPAVASNTSDADAEADAAARALFPGAGLAHVSLRLDASLGALHVRMARPELHNAFNEVLIASLRRIFDGVAAAASDSAASSPLSQLRAVVLTGAGASFSAGADLKWMQKMRTYTEEENLADAKLLFQMVASIAACPVPVIARVNGAALGGGVGLVAACDVAVAVESAKFGLTEVKLGLSPAVISSFVMGKLTPAAASYYFLTGSRFDAEEARRIGLLHQVVADEAALDVAVQKTLEELALNSPKAGQ